MSRPTYALIWFCDWVIDVRILRHRCPRYCTWVANHPWWGPEQRRRRAEAEGPKATKEDHDG